MKSQAITIPTTLSSTILPFCGVLISTTGSPNVFISKKPVLRLNDKIIPQVPVIPLVLPISQSPEVIRYATVSLGSTTSAITTDVISGTFQWPLTTIPKPFPSSGSKTVFINKQPAMRLIDPIIPPTFNFKPETHTVIIGD